MVVAEFLYYESRKTSLSNPFRQRGVYSGGDGGGVSGSFSYCCLFEFLCLYLFFYLPNNI